MANEETKEIKEIIKASISSIGSSCTISELRSFFLDQTGENIEKKIREIRDTSLLSFLKSSECHSVCKVGSSRSHDDDIKIYRISTEKSKHLDNLTKAKPKRRKSVKVFKRRHSLPAQKTTINKQTLKRSPLRQGRYTKNDNKTRVLRMLSAPRRGSEAPKQASAQRVPLQLCTLKPAQVKRSPLREVRNETPASTQKISQQLRTPKPLQVEKRSPPRAVRNETSETIPRISPQKVRNVSPKPPSVSGNSSRPIYNEIPQPVLFSPIQPTRFRNIQSIIQDLNQGFASPQVIISNAIQQNVNWYKANLSMLSSYHYLTHEMVQMIYSEMWLSSENIADIFRVYKDFEVLQLRNSQKSRELASKQEILNNSIAAEINSILNSQAEVCDDKELPIDDDTLKIVLSDSDEGFEPSEDDLSVWTMLDDNLERANLPEDQPKSNSTLDEAIQRDLCNHSEISFNELTKTIQEKDQQSTIQEADVADVMKKDLSTLSEIPFIEQPRNIPQNDKQVHANVIEINDSDDDVEIIAAERFVTGQVLSISIIVVESPIRFWFIHDKKGLQRVMENIKNFYSNDLKANKLFLTEVDLQQGRYVAVKYCNIWHRGVITSSKVGFDGNVKVKFIDYGTEGEVHSSNLRYLLEKFVQISPKIIEGSLNGVTNNIWPVLAVEAFKRKVVGRDMKATVVNFDKSSGTVELEIREEHPTSIGEQLIAEGFAEGFNNNRFV